MKKSRSLEEIKQCIRDKGVIRSEQTIHNTAIEIYNEERVITLHENIQELIKDKLREKYGG